MSNKKSTYPFNKYLEKSLKNEGFKREWDNLETYRNLSLAMIDERNALNLTQEQLAKRSGISQERISNIESGKNNVTIKSLVKIAHAFNKELKIEFV